MGRDYSTSSHDEEPAVFRDDAEQLKHIVCPKCGSDDVLIQMVEVGQRSAHKGVGAIGHANNAARLVTAGMTLGMSNLVWKKSKGTTRTKTVNKTMAVCQCCGHSWKPNSLLARLTQ